VVILNQGSKGFQVENVDGVMLPKSVTEGYFPNIRAIVNAFHETNLVTKPMEAPPVATQYVLSTVKCLNAPAMVQGTQSELMPCMSRHRMLSCTRRCICAWSLCTC
jgi:hypothetical protein